MSEPTPIERLIVSLRDDLEKVTAERDELRDKLHALKFEVSQLFSPTKALELNCPDCGHAAGRHGAKCWSCSCDASRGLIGLRTCAKALGERDELQRRIDAIEKLHHPHDCKADPCGWRGPSGHCYERGQCAGCCDTFPCRTFKAARGESL